MAVQFVKPAGTSQDAVQAPTKNKGGRPPGSKAVVRPVDLQQQVRLYIPHVLRVLGISRKTWTNGVKSGKYPAADGLDGHRPWWSNTTIDALQRSQKDSGGAA